MEKTIQQNFDSGGIPKTGTLLVGVDSTPDIEYGNGEYFIPPPDTQPEIISGVGKGVVNEEQIKNAFEHAYKEWLKNPHKELFTHTIKQTRYM